MEDSGFVLDGAWISPWKADLPIGGYWRWKIIVFAATAEGFPHLVL